LNPRRATAQNFRYYCGKRVEMLFAHLKRIFRLSRLRRRGLRGAQDGSECLRIFSRACATSVSRDEIAFSSLMLKWLTSALLCARAALQYFPSGVEKRISMNKRQLACVKV
jgi:hypothetical protein